MMNKKFVAAVLSLALAGTAAAPVYAAGEAAVTNSAYTTVQSENAPFQYSIVINGKTLEETACVMVSLQGIAKELGFSVEIQKDETILVDNGEVHTTVKNGVDRYFLTTSHTGMVGMSAPLSFGTAPYTVGETTYVPLGLLDALLGSQGKTLTLSNGVITVQAKEDVEIPNPFASCKTLAEAEKLSGFSLNLPQQVPNWVSDSEFRAVSDQMLEAVYRSNSRELRIRKGKGTEDISGDYTSYQKVRTVRWDGIPVTLKGNGSLIYTAVWTDDGYTYSVTASNGMSEYSMSRLVRDIQ